MTRKTNPLTKLELPTTMRHLQVLHEDQSPLLGLGGQDTATAEKGSFKKTTIQILLLAIVIMIKNKQVFMVGLEWSPEYINFQIKMHIAPTW